jgi:hypothetical protein
MLLAAALLSTGSANASLIGDEITFSGTHNGEFHSQTGVVGSDTFSWIINGTYNTRFYPIFTDDSIELGFSTVFSTNAWSFSATSTSTITFSGLDWGGTGILTDVALIQNLNFGTIDASDVSFTNTSVTLDISELLISNSDTIRLDLTAKHVPAVPLPTGGLLLLTAGSVLAGLKSRRRRAA